MKKMLDGLTPELVKQATDISTRLSAGEMHTLYEWEAFSYHNRGLIIECMQAALKLKRELDQMEKVP